jgi:endonuclease YncB( thermonuclease family)
VTGPRFTGGPPPGPPGLPPGVLPGRIGLRKPIVWSFTACYVLRVHDADTLFVDIDVGLTIWSRDRAVRLIGCACRELRDPGGRDAGDYVRGLCPPGTLLRIDSHELDKFGRILGVVYLPDGRSLQSVLIAEGWAVPWDGHGPQPKPGWPRVPIG